MAILITFAVILATLGGALAYSYNRTILWRNRVQNGASQIDVQLKRRSDLIGNLVEVVKGYAAHERETLEAVALARFNGGSVKDASSADAAGAVVARGLLAVAERYPELKANENFLKLQEELVHTEDRVAYARQFYNDAAQRYNTRLESFPSGLVATIGTFERAELFDAPEGAEQAPQIRLS
jgi:LemA protein